MPDFDEFQINGRKYAIESGPEAMQFNKMLEVGTKPEHLDNLLRYYTESGRGGFQDLGEADEKYWNFMESQRPRPPQSPWSNLAGESGNMSEGDMQQPYGPENRIGSQEQGGDTSLYDAWARNARKNPPRLVNPWRGVK